ncbi:transposase [Arthrobacter sp. D3-16]
MPTASLDGFLRANNRAVNRLVVDGPCYGYPQNRWRLSAQVVAIDPSAAFRKALRMRLSRTAVTVDHFHLISRWPTRL